MAEFLAENNASGQNLLYIVSTGNSIIAEILRLKDYIPDIYRLSTKSDQTKYENIILDFSYFKISEAQEYKIEQTEELFALDNEVRENYLELLTRFYMVFESAHRYATDLKNFIDDLNRGYYIQQTLESVLQDGDGKQLMCEALYLFGVILLLIDYHIPGVVRERLLISYYRYSTKKSRNSESNIDDVCMLMRSTGFVADYPTTSSGGGGGGGGGGLANYPELYFARFSFDELFVEMVIGRLRCDDIYNQLTIYPHPEHRSTALANQAAMLFICLYFCPRILHQQVSQMREIVDKFFADNWVICIYMGITVNLIDAWQQFKAAKSALQPIVDMPTNVKAICVQHREKVRKTLKQTNDILCEGVLNDDFVLEHILRIVQLIRQCNVLLRWTLLHTVQPLLVISPPPNQSSQQSLRQIEQFVQNELELGGSSNVLFAFLVNCSQLELEVKEILRNLIENKSIRWQHFKTEATDRIEELSEIFSGNRSLPKIEKNPQLKLWFSAILKEINKLDVASKAANEVSSGRTLVQLIQALEDVQEFHNFQTNMHVKQYLIETGDHLKKMIQVININENIFVNIQLISDFSYAWCLIDRDFTGIMQDCVKRQPKSVIRLRALFLKLASALEIPLLRINQAKSEDMISVSNYYSNELANYMRKVLQIIPENMFRTLARIVHIETEVLKEFPTRLEKDKLKDHAQFDDRYTIAKLTHSIAVFTEGMHTMKKTLVGVIELDAKQLLEDGIRKELVRNLANTLNAGLIFGTQAANPKNKQTKQQRTTALPTVLELESKLSALAKTMNGYTRSFEYVQDYLSIHGLKILQEELKRIIYFNVERECNTFLRNKIHSWQSRYQNRTVPIPILIPLKNDPTGSVTFIGRLAYELLNCTNPIHTIYLDVKATWYEKHRSPHKEVVVSQNFFSKLREALIPAGLVGLDRLYAYMILNELTKNLEKLQTNLTTDKMWLDTLTELSKILDTNALPANHVDAPLKFYANYYNRWLKVWPQLVNCVQEIGQKQILRQQLAFELHRSSKCNARNLESSLETFNRALLIELMDPNVYEKLCESDRTSIFKDISEYLWFIGLSEPLDQIFIYTKNSHHMVLFWFLLTIAHLPRYHYMDNIQSLIARNPKDTLDFMPYFIGLLTVLKQFHKEAQLLYLTYICQFVTFLVESNLRLSNEISVDAVTTLHFLEIFVRVSKIPRSVLIERLPIIVLNNYDHMMTGTK